MIKGFIEVHNSQYDDKVILINVRRIVDIWGSEIYLSEEVTNCIKCSETYEEIKDKIRKAVNDES